MTGGFRYGEGAGNDKGVGKEEDDDAIVNHRGWLFG